MPNNIFKFEKSKYPIIPVAFWLVIVFSLSFIFLILKNNRFNLYIPSYISPLEATQINIERNTFGNTNAFICYDNDCLPLENNYFSKVFYSEYVPDYNKEKNYRFKKITLAYPIEETNFLNSIEDINIYIGNKKYYLTNSDISKIQKKEFKVEITNHNNGKKEIKQYNTLLLSDVGNYRGIYNNICCMFLSLFSNSLMFFVPYFWLFLAFVFYLFKKDEIKFNFKIPKINPIWYLSAITLIGILLRLNDINYYPLWADEVYTKTVAIKDFVSCFKDAGNPPLFFILEYLITKVIGVGNIALRFLPFVFGVLIIPLSYFLFKNINKNLALFASFMAAINTIFIYHSTEARGYTLSALLILLSIYTLFNYLNSPSLKRLVIYGIIIMLCINHNYYLVLFSFANFIWGCVDLFEKKDKKNIFNFIITNIIAALTILPYFIVSFNSAISDSFNGWISPFSKPMVIYTINYFFACKYIFLFLFVVLFLNLVFAFLPDKYANKINIKTNPKINNLLIYLVFNLSFVLITACVISIYFKPIFHKRVLIAIYMLLFLIEVINIFGVVEFVKKNIFTKIFRVLYFIVLFSMCSLMTAPLPVRELIRLDDYMEFLKNDIPKYQKDYEIHAITTDTIEYIDNYPEVKNLNIKWHFVDTNSGEFITDFNKFDYIDKNKKSVIYFNTTTVEVGKATMLNPDAAVFKSNTISTARLIHKP